MWYNKFGKVAKEMMIGVLNVVKTQDKKVCITVTGTISNISSNT